MKLAERLVPKGLQERWETILREFEWTWTKAAIASLVLWFLAIIFIAIIPSWWLYFAGNTLHWTGPPTGAGHVYTPTILGHQFSIDTSFWLRQLGDLIAVILFTIPTVLFMVVPYFVQKQRRKLRGQDVARPAGGYR